MVDILIADTDELYQKAMGKMIDECEGCRLVGTASSGKEAMDLVNSRHPQLVLADANLKKESGITVCKMIRSRLPDAYIYILSNYVLARVETNKKCRGQTLWQFLLLDVQSKIYVLLSLLFQDHR